MCATWVRPEVWTPVRYVQRQEVCDFCWNFIPPGSPGRSTGSRGTRAWYNPALDIWECLACRSEAMRADMARAAETAPEQQQLGPVTGEAA